MPKIGLLSDSHGQAPVTRRAVAVLAEHGAEILIHLGDVETTDVIDALAIDAQADGSVRESHLVFGNVDFDVDGLSRYASGLGVTVDHPAGELELDGRPLVFTHGHMEKLMRQTLARKVAYLCHGHTHKVRDERVGTTRIINPGALYRARPPMVALLDTEADDLAFYPVR